jgi:uncharacterized membrane protein YuzA (DUF378 family)
MATMNIPANERRHIPERRAEAGAARTPALSVVDWVAMVLMIVAGINFGLIGLFDTNLITDAVGVESPLTRLTYALFGLAALYGIYLLARLGSRP